MKCPGCPGSRDILFGKPALFLGAVVGVFTKNRRAGSQKILWKPTWPSIWIALI